MTAFIIGILILLMSCTITFSGVFIILLVRDYINDGRPEDLLFAFLVLLAGYILTGLEGAAIRKMQGKDDFKESFVAYLKLIRFFPMVLLYIVWYGGGLFLLILTLYCLKISGRELGAFFMLTVLWVLLTHYGHRFIRKISMGNIDPDSAVGENTYYENDIRTLVAAVDKCNTDGSFRINAKTYRVNVGCLAFYDEEKGILIPEAGDLHWYIRKEARSYCGKLKGFAGNGMYRVRVREQKSKDAVGTDNTKKYHRFWLERVVDKNVQCPELQAYVDEYNKPIIVKDDFFGELEYNRTEDRFEGEIKSGEESICIYIYAEYEPEKWNECIRNAAELVGDIAELNEKCRIYASKNVDAFDEEGNDLPEQAKYEGISLISLDIYETEIIVTYDSDKLWDSSEVIVNVDKEKGPNDCYMNC